MLTAYPITAAARVSASYCSMGMHNYFQIATCVSSDFADMGREVDVVKLSQLKRKALSAKGDYKGFSFIEKKYGKSKQIRFYIDAGVIPKFAGCVNGVSAGSAQPIWVGKKHPI